MLNHHVSTIAQNGQTKYWLFHSHHVFYMPGSEELGEGYSGCFKLQT